MRLSFELHKYLRLGLLGFISISLAACISNGSPGKKIGMHIDAALEFAVEHPQSWNKDRRLPYRSGQGEVRWTQEDDPEMMLRIHSEPVSDNTATIDQHIDQILQEYPSIELTLKTETVMPAGTAMHLMGYNSQRNFDIYLISSEQRHYSIVFTASADTMGQYTQVIKEIVESFLILSSSNSAAS